MEGSQLTPSTSGKSEMAAYGVRFDGLRLHVEIPDLDGEVISRNHVATGVGKLDVGDGRDDLGEEAAVGWVLGLLEHCNRRRFQIRICSTIPLLYSPYSWRGYHKGPPGACRTIGWCPCWMSRRRGCTPWDGTRSLL